MQKKHQNIILPTWENLKNTEPPYPLIILHKDANCNEVKMKEW